MIVVDNENLRQHDVFRNSGGAGHRIISIDDSTLGIMERDRRTLQASRLNHEHGLDSLSGKAECKQPPSTRGRRGLYGIYCQHDRSRAVLGGYRKSPMTSRRAWRRSLSHIWCLTVHGNLSERRSEPLVFPCQEYKIRIMPLRAFAEVESEWSKMCRRCYERVHHHTVCQAINAMLGADLLGTRCLTAAVVAQSASRLTLISPK